MLSYKNYAISLMLVITFVTASVVTTPVQADGAGAFIGGIAAARIGRSIRDNNDAQEQQAYYAQQTAEAAQAQAQAQASPPQKSVEEQLAELQKLAAGGYITPAEYKTKKQQILDTM